MFCKGSLVVLDGAKEGFLRNELVRVVGTDVDELTGGQGGDGTGKGGGFELFAAGNRSVVAVAGNTLAVLEGWRSVLLIVSRFHHLPGR